MATPLLERTDELAALSAAARAAARGAGTVALVHGEAGIGKSALVHALPSRMPAEGRVLVGWCDALTTPRTLGPFKDVGDALGPQAAAALASGDRDRTMATLRDALAGGPVTTLVVEDVHWADEATVDTLRFLARRSRSLPLVLLLTYRNDELDRDHPLAHLLGDLGHGDGVLRLPLQPLTTDAVASLAAGSDLDAGLLHDLTEGNPYLVTELIASAEPGRVPPTVVDAVLGRLRRLPADVQDLVEQLAVVPGTVRRPLLDRLVGPAWERLAVAEAKGLMTVTGHAVGFRHELTRRAVVDALPGARLATLNRTALAALSDLPEADLSQLVHHAVACDDVDAVVRHAPAAAREARTSGAHREAAAHYATVLEHERRFGAQERAALWEEYAVELYTIGRGSQIVAAQERAVALRRQLGDPAALAGSLRWLSRLAWFGGDRPLAERAASEAVDVAATAAHPALLALTLSNLAQLAMLAEDTERSIALSRRAIDLSRPIGDAAVLSHALNNLGSSLMRSGQDGRAELLEAIEVARAVDDHEDACRAYVNLAWMHLDRHELDDAEPLIRDGLLLAERVEFLAFWQYLRAALARLELARARWEAAVAATAPISTDAYPARCVALGVLALVAARTGGDDPHDLLEEGWALARRLAEPQRTAPMAAVLLEVGELTGRAVPLDDAQAAYDDAWRTRNRPLAEELAYRLGRAGRPVPAEHLVAMLAGVPTPYALMAAGRCAEAARAWRAAGCPYQEAEALAGSGDPADLLAALDILDELGAAPLARRVRRALRASGATRIPRGPAGSTRADPAGLTRRQVDVLALLAAGLTNAEIAERLVVSVRTVDSHVAAILARLGVGGRHEAVAAYQRLPGPRRASDLGTAPA